MLSQTPRAILMRSLRARRRDAASLKSAGRRPDLAKHRMLVTAFEQVSSRRFGNLGILACDLGYAHRDSLTKAYRRAVMALSDHADADGEGR